jgi:hypothetical protein
VEKTTVRVVARRENFMVCMAGSKGCAFEWTNLQIVRVTLLFLNPMASSILRCTVILDFRRLLREKLGEKLLLFIKISGMAVAENLF